MAIRYDTICHLARAAALTGKVEKWDPKKEYIVGDNPEASKLLSLPYREKWRAPLPSRQFFGERELVNNEW